MGRERSGWVGLMDGNGIDVAVIASNNEPLGLESSEVDVGGWRRGVIGLAPCDIERVRA
jgi:hypothetical protein